MSQIFICLIFLFLSAPLYGQMDEARYSELTWEQEGRFKGRKIRIYLPPSYSKKPQKSYPVLYMMDGQNLYKDRLAYGGFAWNIQKVADSLVAKNEIREFIIVGIDNAGKDRFAEYMPQKVFQHFAKKHPEPVREVKVEALYADQFLKFLSQDLKTVVDARFRTQESVENTYIGGSSMGGLISCYALCEYPTVFGGAICLSSHWPVTLDNSQPDILHSWKAYLNQHIPEQKKFYFDHGSKGLDRFYEPYQKEIDAIFLKKGYQEQKGNWQSKKFAGADHNERSWYQRLGIPLHFIFSQG
ncbi:MAG: alpha/beta hydrolase-fold protein [Bacteroidota bacterium]